MPPEGFHQAILHGFQGVHPAPHRFQAVAQGRVLRGDDHERAQVFQQPIVLFEDPIELDGAAQGTLPVRVLQVESGNETIQVQQAVPFHHALAGVHQGREQLGGVVGFRIDAPGRDQVVGLRLPGLKQ